MGKHSESELAIQSRTRGAVSPTVGRPVTPRYRGRLRSNVALSLFAFAATFGFVMVNVTDPTAGAVASPYYQAPIISPDAQTIVAAGSSQVITRDGYAVTEAPKAAAAPAASSSSSSGSSRPGAAAVPDPGSAQAIAAEKVAARGWGSGEFDCLVALWNKESGWRVNAYNSSGAYGIPQALPGSKMSSAGADWETSAATQIEWGLGYITSRYGSPCGAWDSSQSRGWY